MTRSILMILVFGIGALALQGHAQEVQTATARATQQATAAPVAATAPVGAGQSAATIPENSKGKPVVAADTKEHFEAVAAAVRQQMDTGGRFAFVSSSGRATVDSALNDMSVLFNQYGSVDKMSPPAQSKLMADQNSINEVLARYDSNRLICSEEIPVGTHFPKKVCRTLGEIQLQNQNSKQTLNWTQQRQNQMQAVPHSGSGH